MHEHIQNKTCKTAKQNKRTTNVNQEAQQQTINNTNIIRIRKKHTRKQTFKSTGQTKTNKYKQWHKRN